jgi:hypothetical protein
MSERVYARPPYYHDVFCEANSEACGCDSRAELQDRLEAAQAILFRLGYVAHAGTYIRECSDNAKLIAKVPEMYEFLKRIAALCPATDTDTMIGMELHAFLRELEEIE